MNKKLQLHLNIGTEINIDCDLLSPEENNFIRPTIQVYVFDFYGQYTTLDMLNEMDFSEENSLVSFEEININANNDDDLEHTLNSNLSNSTFRFISELFRANNEKEIENNSWESIYDVLVLNTENENIQNQIAILENYLNVIDDSDNELTDLLEEKPWEHEEVMVVINFAFFFEENVN